MNSQLELLERREGEAQQLEQLYRQSREDAQRKKYVRLSRLVVVLTLLCVALMVLLAVFLSLNLSHGKSAASEAEGVEQAVAQTGDESGWQLMLVNKTHLVPTDFTVDLIGFEDVRVDYRIADALTEMVAAAEKDGVTLTVCAGFLTVSEQKALFDKKVESYEALGYSAQAGKLNAEKYLQSPGASEHHTGLAVDFGVSEETALDQSFADTPAYRWLMENAAAYGFIERYPQGKSDITGVAWEPWHFRFVGKANAKAVTSLGICLEEFA